MDHWILLPQSLFLPIFFTQQQQNNPPGNPRWTTLLVSSIYHWFLHILIDSLQMESQPSEYFYWQRKNYSVYNQSRVLSLKMRHGIGKTISLCPRQCSSIWGEPKDKLRFLPESGHKVHRGPAQDKGPQSVRVAFSHFVHTACCPHVSQLDFIFYLKIVVISSEIETKTDALVLLFLEIYRRVCIC